MTLQWLLLIIAFVLLFGGMIYYAYHLKKLRKEEQDDFYNARTDDYLIKSNKKPSKTKRKKGLDTLRWVLLLLAVAGMTVLMTFLLITLAGWCMGMPRGSNAGYILVCRSWGVLACNMGSNSNFSRAFL